MIIVGLTGGIASGKTTISNFIRKQNIPVHDSDACVYNLYKKPSIKFIDYLKLIGLKKAIKEKKINKKIIRNEVFNNNKKLKKLEEFIHQQIKISRNRFLKKQEKLNKDLIVFDIPLLFEKKLENICDYVFLAHSPLSIRRSRALKRKNMNKKILKKIISLQKPDKIKMVKSDFIINTSSGKTLSNNQVLKAIKFIKEIN